MSLGGFLKDVWTFNKEAVVLPFEAITNREIVNEKESNTKLGALLNKTNTLIQKPLGNIISAVGSAVPIIGAAVGIVKGVSNSIPDKSKSNQQQGNNGITISGNSYSQPQNKNLIYWLLGGTAAIITGIIIYVKKFNK